MLFYPTAEKPTGRRGRPPKYDGAIDFSRLDTSRCTEHEVDKGKLYGLKAWSKALKRMVSLAVWYPDEDRTDKWQLYFSTDQNQSTLDVLEYYRTRFQLEFCFRDSKQYAGITNCQSTDFRKLAFHFNASLTAINIAKAACKRMGIPYSISSCKSMIHNAYMLERFICVFGIKPDTTLIDKIFKELKARLIFNELLLFIHLKSDEMKKIEAIIRRTRFEDVKQALLDADIEWFSYYDVRGVGKTREGRIYRGIVYDTSSIERILLSVVVRNKNVEKTVNAITAAARTGEIGDGRIFIIPVEDAVRIRTGERGDIALYNAEQEK